MAPFSLQLIFLFSLSCGLLFAEPPRKIPSHLRQEFTHHGRIPVDTWYFNDSQPPTAATIYTTQEIERNLQAIAQKKQHYYDLTDLDLYTVLEKYTAAIKGKQVAIIGSTTPWYESIAIYYGAHPTTIEYNKIISEDPRLKTMTVAEYEKNPEKYDAIISISSIEHDGLGRYGDPINPYGDIQAMQKLQSMLKEDGILFFAVPIGKDRLVWNAHRIYGKIRLPMLLAGWKIIDSPRFSPQDLEEDNTGRIHQPVLVLQSNRA